MKRSELSKKIVATLLTGTIALYTMPVFAASKDEVVYSKINGNNEDYSTIVSDKITNDQRQEYVNDLSNLLNIVNTSGDEAFTQDGNKIVWNANGNSLSYQGDTNQELPIKTTVTYKLNNEEVTADDLKGKEGRVSITVNYENTDSHNVKINGKTEKMYTPFIVVAGLLINKDNNENITVTKGKVVDNGKNAIAVGMALPGLQESLGLSKSDVDIPSSITFEMDAKDFEMNNIVSYVTPKLVEETDLKVFDKMDSLYADANKLQSSMNQIQDGANQLKEGTTELANGTSQVDSGVKEVATNMSKVTSGATQLVSGQKQVTSGLKQIKGKLPTSAQVTENKTQLNTLKAGNTQALTQLNAQSTNTDAQIKELTAKEKEVENNMNLIKSSLKQNGVIFSDSNIDTIIKNYNDNQAKATAAAGQYASAGDTTKASEYKLKATQAGAVVANLNTYKALLGTETLINSTIKTLTASQTSVASLETLITGDQQVVESSLNTLDSMTALSSGVDRLLAGSNKLQTGAQSLQTGSKQLENGVNTLSSATTQLSNGANQVSDGANTLADGITTFNEDGIKKVVNYINGDVKDMKERADALKDLANKYNNFSGIGEDTEGTVSFVIIVDNIKKDE